MPIRNRRTGITSQTHELADLDYQQHKRDDGVKVHVGVGGLGHEGAKQHARCGEAEDGGEADEHLATVELEQPTKHLHAWQVGGDQMSSRAPSLASPGHSVGPKPWFAMAQRGLTRYDEV